LVSVVCSQDFHVKEPLNYTLLIPLALTPLGRSVTSSSFSQIAVSLRPMPSEEETRKLSMSFWKRIGPKIFPKMRPCAWL
jgi:hypothetical protein